MFPLAFDFTYSMFYLHLLLSLLMQIICILPLKLVCSCECVFVSVRLLLAILLHIRAHSFLKNKFSAHKFPVSFVAESDELLHKCISIWVLLHPNARECYVSSAIWRENTNFRNSLAQISRNYSATGRKTSPDKVTPEILYTKTLTTNGEHNTNDIVDLWWLIFDYANKRDAWISNENKFFLKFGRLCVQVSLYNFRDGEHYYFHLGEI